MSWLDTTGEFVSGNPIPYTYDSGVRGYRMSEASGGFNPRRFRPTEHLACEAIAAYSDGELGSRAYLRAAQHLSECAECAAEVATQQQARERLRDSGEIAIPRHLLGMLGRIPDQPAPMSAGGNSVDGKRSLWPWRKSPQHHPPRDVN